jgi:hypothetical protein
MNLSFNSRKLNPTKEQLDYVLAVTQGKKMSPAEYARAQKAVETLPIPKKPKTINNTLPGYMKNEVKLTNDFNASADLPKGWAAVSMYDSGGNHKILNAGSSLLRQIWNTTSSK